VSNLYADDIVLHEWHNLFVSCTQFVRFVFLSTDVDKACHGYIIGWNINIWGHGLHHAIQVVQLQDKKCT
jgi:hypothetical protein